MKDLEQMLDTMPEEVYQRLLCAVEIGKWEDGSLLTQEQKDSSLQLIILYQARHLDQYEHLTVSSKGTVNELSKAELKQQFNGESIAEFKEQDL